MAKQRSIFVTGSVERGVPQEQAAYIFDLMEKFAGYGFNKAHAVAYGWIAYQTAFLKANYPLQYFAALMSSVRDKTDKLVEYIDEAKKMGIAVLPPHVNESRVTFTVTADREIRFGLAAIKGVGDAAIAVTYASFAVAGVVYAIVGRRFRVKFGETAA